MFVTFSLLYCIKLFLEKKKLYLIPKSHPLSKKKQVQWRVSFSVVEREIMRNIPEDYKKVYVFIKDINKDFLYANYYPN